MAKTDQPQAGMEKPELRTHVKFARRQPVHIAFALGADGRAIILMDKRKQPRAVLKELKSQATDARNHRFGAMMFDPDNPKLARITVDKAASGMARKLVVAFKGTGVKQIQLMTEDGQEFESAQNEDDEDEDDEEGGDAVSQSSADQDDHPNRPRIHIKPRNEEPAQEWQPDAEMSAEQAEDGSDGTEYDADALKSDLVGLVKRMMDVIAKDPAQKAGLAELATDAQASLKRGDLAQAAAGIDVLREALDSSGQSAAGTSPAAEQQTADEKGKSGDTTDPAPAAGTGAQAVQRYRKSRAVWLATRAKIDADIKKLSDTILSLDHGGAFGDDLEQNFLNSIDPILSTLDDSLADILTAAEQATSQDEATQALDQARTTIGLYQSFVQSDDTIKQLDQNPFMPMAIAKTLNASLQVLSAAMK